MGVSWKNPQEVSNQIPSKLIGGRDDTDDLIGKLISNKDRSPKDHLNPKILINSMKGTDDRIRTEVWKRNLQARMEIYLNKI